MKYKDGTHERKVGNKKGTRGTRGLSREKDKPDSKKSGRTWREVGGLRKN